MIDIDDERRIDEYLNESPWCDLSHVSMSNSKNNETSIPSIVEVESSDFSTLDRNFNDNENDHSSEDNVGNEDNNEVEDLTLQSKNPNTNQIPVAVASSIYTSIDTFFWFNYSHGYFCWYTIDFISTKIVYAGVILTGLTTRDIPQSVNVNLSPSDNRKWLPGDFTLKKNSIDLAEIVAMKINLDHTKFRLFHMSSVVATSDHFVPIPIDYFLCGLSLHSTLPFVIN